MHWRDFISFTKIGLVLSDERNMILIGSKFIDPRGQQSDWHLQNGLLGDNWKHYQESDLGLGLPQ